MRALRSSAESVTSLSTQRKLRRISGMASLNTFLPVAIHNGQELFGVTHVIGQPLHQQLVHERNHNVQIVWRGLPSWSALLVESAVFRSLQQVKRTPALEPSLLLRFFDSFGRPLLFAMSVAI